MKLVFAGGTTKIKAEFLEKVANAAFSCFSEKEGEIELRFVSSKEIRELNSQYRDKDMPTDVLSFSLSDKPLTGQIFICYNIAQKQAGKFGKEIDDEIALLLVHGILHIFGYDHDDSSEASKMETFEEEILNKIGIKR